MPDKPTAAKPPNPGTDAAIDAGCTCPVLDNGRGRGWMGIGSLFVISHGCPIHGSKIEKEKNDAE